MFHKLLITFLLILLTASPCAAEANPKKLVDFDLSLAGYRLGMSFDEVAAVRSFDYEQASTLAPGDVSTFYAIVDHVSIDGVDMSIQVNFKNEKVYKILARIPPASYENVLKVFQDALGAGENRSRVFTNYADREIRETVYLWDYPNAEVHMVSVSTNTEFATISLAVK